VPSPAEIASCRDWLDAELELLAPRLLIPVGKLAIGQFVEVARLVDVIGRCHAVERGRARLDVIPLPHPSGASTWHRTEPGQTLLREALQQIAAHPAWRSLL
jgi:uracil-DNA glycosylase